MHMFLVVITLWHKKGEPYFFSPNPEKHGLGVLVIFRRLKYNTNKASREEKMNGTFYHRNTDCRIKASV